MGTKDISKLVDKWPKVESYLAMVDATCAVDRKDDDYGRYVFSTRLSREFNGAQRTKFTRFVGELGLQANWLELTLVHVHL